MRSLNIIHLSDLHIDAKGDAEITPMTEALCIRLLEFRNERSIDQFDLLVVSGDLVNRGSDSYDLVEKVLEEICLAGGFGKDRVFMVPGNHDVTRHRYNPTFHADPHNKLKQNPFCLETEEDDYSRALSPLFEKYISFIQNFPLMVNEHQKFKLPGFIHHKLDIDGLTLNLCGLNSALVAGPNDDNPSGISKEVKELQNRCCGFHYLSRMVKNTRNNLNLVVSHYPLSWIHELERQKVQQLLQQKNAILLTGHTHQGTEEASGLVQNQLLQLGAGTAYGKRWGGKNSCRIIRLSTEKNEVLLHDYIWFGDHGWRAFEPIKAQCAGWALCRNLLHHNPNTYRRALLYQTSNVISAFYPNRDYLQKFEDVIRFASNEIFLVCNIGGHLVANLWNFLERKAIEGCSIKILFANPKNGGQANPLIPLLAEITNHQSQSFEHSLPQNLKTIQMRLGKLKKRNNGAFNKIEIKLYNTLVTLVILFVDANPDQPTSASRINVELLPHKFLGSERPSFDLNLDKKNELPKKLYKQYQILWDDESTLLALPEES